MANEKYVAYVGTYTYESSIGIHVYDLDVKTGKMTEKKVVPINNPSDLIISNNGKYLYSIADEGVRSFQILKDGDLKEINGKWTGGMRGCYLDIDDEGRYLFVGSYHDGRISMMKLNPEDGSIVGIADGVFHKAVGRNISDRSSRPHINCVKLTPDQHYVCAVDGGLDNIKIYKIDYENGKLNMIDIVRGDIDTAPRMIRFSKNGKFAYVLNELSNTIDAYKYYEDERGPEFERIQTVVSDLNNDERECTALDIELSADGKYLYASNDDMNSVIIYKIDSKTGMLEMVSLTKIRGEFPKSIAILPDGKHFLCACHDTNEINNFVVDNENKYVLMDSAPINVEMPNCIFIHKLA
ncbi:MAG: lactonase family protein [Lachnospiraceae bacterium]|nr:lactonase family protein [Lachnospiraceae bacterium]